MRIRAALVALLLTAGCGTGAAATDPHTVLRVGVSPSPHGEILKHVADILAKDKNLKIKVVEFTDYVLPNTALVDGDIDANYFQTQPNLDAFKQTTGAPLEWIGAVHLEPLGLYSKKIHKLADLPTGARIGIAKEGPNQTRGLALLQANGRIKVRTGTEATATLRDVEYNPGQLEFVELEPSELPRSLEDTDASVVNGNYAIGAGLKPSLDALVLEKAEGNPNANGLVTRTELKDDPRIAELIGMLQSKQVKDYIKQKFSGTALPV